MRVLHLIPYYIPAYRFGGPVFSIHTLCKYLNKIGVDVEVWTTNLGLDFEKIKENNIDGVKIIYFPILSKFNYAFSTELLKYMNFHIREFDLVHINGIYQFHSISGGFFSKKYEIPYVLSPRGMLIKDVIRKKGFIKKIIYINLFEKRTINNAAMIHLTSEDERKEIIRMGIKEEKTFVIPNPFDFSQYNSYKEKREGNKILFLGRINWKKGLDILIPAFKIVVEEFPDAKLIVAGPDDGYLDKVKRWIDENGISKNVEITGEIVGEKKIEKFLTSDIFILPSYSENFGMSVAESLFYKTPVIISEKVGIKEYIERYNCGIITKLNVDEIANSIIRLLKDKEMRVKMGIKGYKMVINEFNPLRIAKDMKKEYERIVKKGER